MRQETGKAAGVVYALVLLIFVFTLAVVLTLNFRLMYYLDISRMQLERSSGLNEKAIRANYDALITYNQLWNRGALNFPSLPMSETARIHFAEVKRIFDGIQIACFGSGIFSIGILTATRHKRRPWLKITGLLGIFLPAVLGMLAAVGWDRFFTTFHQILFANDYWLFDPATDPVILILPDGYFLQCTVLIVGLVIAGSILCLAGAGRSRR